MRTRLVSFQAFPGRTPTPRRKRKCCVHGSANIRKLVCGMLTSDGASLESLNSLNFVGGSTKRIVLNSGKRIEGELVDARLDGIEMRSAIC
jgi:hypothetical protein